MSWVVRTVAVIAVGTAGLLVGWGIAALTDDSSGDAAVARENGAPVYDCPNGQVVGAFERESRVYVVGRSQPPGWLQIRDLDQPGLLVWINEADLALDADLGNVRVDSCASQAGVSAVGEPDDTTQTTTPTPTTATTEGPTTPTPTAAPPPIPIPTPTPTPTSTEPDTTPPTIANASATPSEIWELDTGFISCGNLERESLISVFVTDSESGVDQVRATWTIGGDNQGVTLARSGNTYSETFGPFDYLTVPDNTEQQISITVRAVDNSGNASTTTVSVQVHSTSQCFG